MDTVSKTSTLALFDALVKLKNAGLSPWQVIDSVLGSALTTGLEFYLDQESHELIRDTHPDDLITMVYLVYSHDHTSLLPASIVRHLNILHRSTTSFSPYSLMIDWSYGYVAEDSVSEKVVTQWLKRFTFSSTKSYQRRLSVFLYLQARSLGL